MNLVVIGAQWGDEGKGKIVDFLASDAELIVRFSGGANAGHTIVHGQSTYKVHLVPSGILYPNSKVILGSGMVIDPEALFKELDGLKDQGIDWEGRVLISQRAHLVLPGHKKLDVEMDQKRKNPIGTTGRGIGVAYSLKSSRDGIRMVDITDPARLENLSEDDLEFLNSYKPKLEPMLLDITSHLHQNSYEKILMEGAQGVLLDLDLGTYPYVSSGYSAAAGAALGAGIGPRKIDGILGVFKAYSTRVGNGPFPTEFKDDRDGDLGEKVRTIGKEFGVTTGRARRCGYLDLVALKYAVQANGIDGLVMTKIDIYDSFDEISLCTAYEINGARTEQFSARISDLEQAQPVLKTFPGWKSELSNSQSYEELPQEVKNYIDFIEEYIGVPITIVSVGQGREQTIIRQEIWKKY